MFHSHIHVLKCDYGYLNAFVDMGAIAMTGFFLLSGYVLDFSCRRKDMSDVLEIKNFYIKRFISIIPLYYAYAIINVVINVVLKGNTAAMQEILLFPIEALGIQSVYSSLFPYSHNGGSWFISCILICYFVYPLIYLLTQPLNYRIKMGLIGGFAAILLWSPFLVHFFGLGSIYSNPFFRLLEFSIGIMVAQLNASTNESKLLKVLRSQKSCLFSILLLFVGVSVAYHMGISHDYMLYSWIALPCFVSLLFSLGSIRFARFEKTKIVQYLSALSFALFLSQLQVVWHFTKFVFDYFCYHNNLANIGLSALLCFCIANGLHYLIEKPSAKYLKEKFL